MSATTAFGTHWKLSIHSRTDSWVSSSLRVFCGAAQTKWVAIEDHQDVVDRVQQVNIAVVQEHHISKALRSDARDTRATWRWRRAEADFTRLDHVFIQVVDGSRQSKR